MPFPQPRWDGALGAPATIHEAPAPGALADGDEDPVAGCQGRMTWSPLRSGGLRGGVFLSSLTEPVDQAAFGFDLKGLPD